MPTNAAPNRKTRRLHRFGGAGLTSDSRVITLRANRSDATPGRSERAKRIRERRRLTSAARRAAR